MGNLFYCNSWERGWFGISANEKYLRSEGFRTRPPVADA